jgi:transposase
MAFQKRNIRHVLDEGSNSPTEQNRCSTQRKDRPTRAAHKADHAVDLKTELIVAAEILQVDVGNSHALEDFAYKAHVNLKKSKSDVDVHDVVADKGYYSAAVIETFAEPTPFRTYVPEQKLPDCQTHCWTDKPETQREAAYAIRRHSPGDRETPLQRQQSAKVERTFAHVCATGGVRPTGLRGIEKATKRYPTAAKSENINRLIPNVLQSRTTRRPRKPIAEPLRLPQSLQFATVRLAKNDSSSACGIESVERFFRDSKK